MTSLQTVKTSTTVSCCLLCVDMLNHISFNLDVFGKSSHYVHYVNLPVQQTANLFTSYYEHFGHKNYFYVTTKIFFQKHVEVYSAKFCGCI